MFAAWFKQIDASDSACVVYTKTIIYLGVGESGGLFTSTPVSC